MGGSSSGGDSTIRHSEYLESAHKNALNLDGTETLSLSVFGAMNDAFGASPYGTMARIDVDSFLGDFNSGMFPTLADMFGKFMAGLDVEVLWTQLYNESTAGTEVNDATSAQAKYLRDEIDTTVMPKFLAGYRDINAVMSSAFINGRAIIEDTYINAVEKFRASMALKMVDITQERWKMHLEWNNKVIATYSEVLKLYTTGKIDTDNQHMDFQVKDKMWDLSTFEYGRAMLGALGGGSAAGSPNAPSQASKSISGALSGAAMGATVGGPWGAAAGGVLGLAASFF